jgi:hypothetical protein
VNYLVAMLVLAIGVGGIGAGEADDSPGLQLLGVALVVAAVARGVRLVQRRTLSWPVRSMDTGLVAAAPSWTTDLPDAGTSCRIRHPRQPQPSRGIISG